MKVGMRLLKADSGSRISGDVSVLVTALGNVDDTLSDPRDLDELPRMFVTTICTCIE